MINVLNREDCCGCNACGDACLANAIGFERDMGGFLYPTVDRNKCDGCGACDAVCPMGQIEVLRKSAPQRPPANYAAIANNLYVRFDSTSGGLFSVLAEDVFKQGGYVGGAVWDEEFFIHQVLTDNIEDLPRLRSSKYAQSDARGFYRGIKAALQTGKPVLVCGLPCQMVAVRTFLKKDYENLLVVDLICRTTSSPFFLKRYIEYQEKRMCSKVVAIKQKDKGLGWRNLTTKLTFDNGEIAYDPKYSSYFMRTFEANLISRPACYSCRFKGFPRLADITLADCWGAVDKIPKHLGLDNNIGTSLVMCNTDRGRAFFERIKCSGDISFTEVMLEDVVKGNFGLLYPVPRPRIDPAEIYDRMKSVDLNALLDPILEVRTKISQGVVHWIVGLLKCVVRRVRRVRSLGRYILTAIRVNGLKKVIGGLPLAIPRGRLLIQMDAGARFVVNRDTTFSNSFVRGSRIESRIRFWPNSMMTVNGGSFGTNTYILLFEGARLEIGENCCINVNFSVTCGSSIKIGNNVFIGQNVSIRDTHGDHFINTPDYQNTKPVEIGDHVWIASDAMIMPGVKIGAGSIVAARSLVTKDVPAGTMVAGIPAKVIRKNVQFRC